jgi:hypothetical protein
MALIWANTSVPLRPGIATSKITRSILVGSCLKSRSASCPSAASRPACSLERMHFRRCGGAQPGRPKADCHFADQRKMDVVRPVRVASAFSAVQLGSRKPQIGADFAGVSGNNPRNSLHCRLCGGEGGIRTPGTLSGTPVFKTGAFNHSATSPTMTVTVSYYGRRETRSRAHTDSPIISCPFGYTNILLASPVFKRAMAWEKSFIAMRSVITG